MRTSRTSARFGIAALCLVAVVSAASPAAAQTSASGKWGFEFHTGGMLPTNPTAGTASLPSAGQPFATAAMYPPPAPPVITVASINGVAINANPFSFPDTTINTGSPVPVVIQATNLPVNATVTLYVLSDTAANQAIPLTLVGNTASSSATIPVTFPSGRLKLLTSPARTGSAPLVNTIGIVVVSDFATRTVLLPPVAAMTATRRAIRSAASARNRSG